MKINLDHDWIYSKYRCTINLKKKSEKIIWYSIKKTTRFYFFQPCFSILALFVYTKIIVAVDSPLNKSIKVLQIKARFPEHNFPRKPKSCLKQP